MNLTEDQAKAEQYILSFSKNKMPSMFLVGRAGTGKSFVISRAIKKMLGVRVGLTAPTNKATGVLRRFAVSNDMRNVTISTLHSLLKLKPKLVKEGNIWVQKFVEDKKVTDGKHPLRYLDFVVVDEASMLNSDLYNKLIEAQKALNNSIKLLFVGDRYQLPPVGEKESLVFSKETNVVELKTVVRQALDNPLGGVLSKMTDGVFSGEDTFKRDSNLNDSGGVFFTNKTEVFLAGILKKFKSEEYAKDKNYVRVLSWTNDRVKNYNRYIRKNIIGTDVEPYTPGEIMILKSTSIDPVTYSVVANISEEFIIVKVFKTSYSGFRCYILYANFIDREKSKSADDVTEIRVIHPDDVSLYKKYMDSLLAKAKESGEAADWRKFYGSKDMFTEIDYAYSLTVHNSQGSTFNTVFVDETDIDKNPNKVERMQCKYTAFSRPSSKLIVYSEK